MCGFAKNLVKPPFCRKIAQAAESIPNIFLRIVSKAPFQIAILKVEREISGSPRFAQFRLLR